MVLNVRTAKALGLAVPHRFCCAPPRWSNNCGYVSLWHRIPFAAVNKIPIAIRGL
jgi:hypothetical protein